MTGFPFPAVVRLSFLAIVRAAVAFNPLDAGELFFFWYGSAGMRLTVCLYNLVSAISPSRAGASSIIPVYTVYGGWFDLLSTV